MLVKDFIEKVKEFDWFGEFGESMANKAYCYANTIAYEGKCATVFEEELAMTFLSFGCTVDVFFDYLDGSDMYSVYLPDTEEEYRKNIAEAEVYLT